MNRKAQFIKSPILRQQVETIANHINLKNVKPMSHIVLLNESQEKSAASNFKENLRDDSWDNNNQY
ncbi:hypothetical protein [Variovorax sp. RA8]|uniref:hypothetical protein n=1 Tax=Variovorax sp. (strain JCM 16519 / RA8) TaxID=662548 RepID=UPI000B287963|nr:hypothetical protein [Variovorax sp. RA8]